MNCLGVEKRCVLQYWRNKVKFSSVTLKNKISACKVASWIAREQCKLFIWGSRTSLAINWELVSRLLSGGQLTTVRGLLASSPVADDHLFWGLFGLIRSHHTPHALFACLQLSPFSLEIIISRLRCLSTVWIEREFGILYNCVYREINLLVPIRGHFENAAKYTIFAGNYSISPDLPALIFYLNQLRSCYKV